MSRILRRPMFRGGRVDSRGTGITSGLKYKQGGRVGFANGGGYKFGETPAAKGLGWLNNEFNKMLAAGYDLGAVPINTFARMFGYNPGFSGAKWMDNMTMGEFSKMNPEINKDQAWFLNPWGPTSAEEGWTIPSMGGNVPPPTGIKGPPGGGETRMGSGEAVYDKPAGPTEAELALAELNKLLADQNKSKKDAKETIEEYKEVFKDAYGSGVADDASRMLMSFAGKALKPGADTKSAFGEFFEEESKVPSESKKYKDAATTAAINAYLTGEKSFNDTMKAIEIAKATTKAKVDILAQGKGWDDYLIEGAGTGGDPRKMGAISYAVSKMGEELGGVLPKLKEGETYGNILKEDVIYVQDSPDGSFKILVKWDGEKLVPIKQVYKR